MDYFAHNARRGQQPSDVVEFDRNVGDTARILRNEHGEAAGFVVTSDNAAAPSVQGVREFAARWLDAYAQRGPVPRALPGYKPCLGHGLCAGECGRYHG